MPSLLFATVADDLSTPYPLAPAISTAASHTRDRLLIILFSRSFNSPGISCTAQWNQVQRLLTFVYVQATKVAQDMSNVLMQVDVLLKGLGESIPEGLGHGADMIFRLRGDTIQVPLPTSMVCLQTTYINPGPNPEQECQPQHHSSPQPNPPSRYPVVALGGTFDHLHAGHKILLSMAAWIASEKVIVGITDDALLTSKLHRQVLESLATRTAHVHAFLALFRPGLTYDIVPITDVYGPTGWDPHIQALVVSKETVAGAATIATHRAACSLPPLQTYVIDVISPSEASLDGEDIEMLKKTKMSSTFIREWIVEGGGGGTKD